MAILRGSVEIRILIFACVTFFFLNVNVVHSFYLPGVAPQDFQMVSTSPRNVVLFCCYKIIGVSICTDIFVIGYVESFLI